MGEVVRTTLSAHPVTVHCFYTRSPGNLSRGWLTVRKSGRGFHTSAVSKKVSCSHPHELQTPNYVYVSRLPVTVRAMYGRNIGTGVHCLVSQFQGHLSRHRRDGCLLFAYNDMGKHKKVDWCLPAAINKQRSGL